MAMIKSLFWAGILAALAMFATADFHHYPLSFWKSPHADFTMKPTALPWETILQVAGMLYAILGGVLLLKGLERRSKLTRALEGEVNAAQGVRDYLSYFTDDRKPIRRRIVTQLLDYLVSIRTTEVKRLKHPRRGTLSSDLSKELRETMNGVRDVEASDATEVAALEGMLGRMTELASFRGARIGLAYSRLPGSLKLLMGLLALVLVTVVALMPVGLIWLHLTVVGVVAGVVTLFAGAINDLDRPFGISLKSLHDAEEQFHVQLEELDRALPGPQELELEAPVALHHAAWNPVAQRMYGGS